ncbi:hypothetical protein ACO0RG_002267 [Hanseniaspora osmophila]|uniref:Mitochondrial carrier protein MTM1 n=1 Tax=Hanseniaspora osmophila TaxID=56408 RepID=A0A1E5RH04_9ASCO|nr:Mitochondrial carrier protein MTM1 [Hanseniaspora osmophila]
MSLSNDTANPASQTSNGTAIHQRMLSACIGSLFTSLFLTPMDVVRVRVQQQGMLPGCDCPPVSEPILESPPVRNAQNALKRSTLAPSKLTQKIPLPAVFWEEQCFKDLHCSRNPQTNFTGTLDAFKKISQFEGIRTLWRGLSLTLLMAIPSNVVYYSGYESLRDLSPLNAMYPTLNSFGCGAFARVIAATTVAPLELLKTRLQSIPASSGAKSFGIIKDLLVETRFEINKVGYRALFKGLEITFWRDVPFSAIYWGSYESYKKNMWFKNFFFTTAPPDSNWNYFLNTFIGGSISGTIAGLITHPFDVGKTRLQISAMRDDKAVSALNGSNSYAHNKNMFVYLNNVKKAEGIGALYAGLLPRLIKIAPSCAIMISTYEVTKKLFQQEGLA